VPGNTAVTLLQSNPHADLAFIRTVYSQGNRITPSYVGFAAGSGERLVGDAAKNQAPQNPENTIFDASGLRVLSPLVS
jgi:molecular chaperone DnaK (HSP70)